MIYKLVGTVLVLSCAVAYSEQRGKKDRERIRNAKTLLRFFDACRSGVSSYALTLAEIIDGFECEQGWSDLLLKIRSNGLANSAELAKEVLCGAEERDIYANFAHRFGRGFIRDSEEVCRECSDKLKGIIAELEDKAKKDGRTRLAISLCVSFMTCLLFL